MPSLSQQWKETKDAWNDDTSPKSPGARFGLMFDPLAYILGDKYRNFIKKTGDESNRSLSHWIGSDDRGGWVANKPASTIGLIIGGSYAGGGMFGGGSGAGAHEGTHAASLGNSSFTGAPAGGMQNMQLPQQQQKQPENTWLADELERQEKERKLKALIADQLGPQYV